MGPHKGGANSYFFFSLSVLPTLSPIHTRVVVRSMPQRRVNESKVGWRMTEGFLAN